MDCSEFCNVPYKILAKPWSTRGSSRSNNLGENSWLDDYMGSDCLDGPTLAEFLGDAGIHSSYKIVLIVVRPIQVLTVAILDIVHMNRAIQAVVTSCLIKTCRAS